jgi:hypothetical protein
MNDREKERVQREDLVEWLDARIAQPLEQRLKQQFAQEQEHWRCHVIDSDGGRTRAAG